MSGKFSFDETKPNQGFWAGRQKDNSIVICLDFDIYGKPQNNTKLDEARIELFNSIQNHGCFSSSTTGNYGIICDITNCYSLMKHIGKRKKITITEGDLKGLEVLVQWGVVLPPTATIDKSTGKLGSPRQWMSNVKILEVLPFNPIELFIKENIPEYVEPIKETNEPIEPISNSTSKQQLIDIFNTLPEKYLKEYFYWFRIGCIMKRYKFSVEEFAKVSRRVAEYANEPLSNYQKLWDSIYDMDMGTGCSIATAWYWLKQENKKEFIKLQRKYQEVDIPENERQLIENLIQSISKDCIVEEEGKQRKLTFYDGDLWRHRNSEKWVYDALVKQIDESKYRVGEIIGQFQLEMDSNSVANNDNEMEEMSKLYSKYSILLDQVAKLHTLTKTTMKIMTATNDFVDWGQNANHIHFKNGVWDIKNHKFRKRKREDMANDCCPYEYKDPTVEDRKWLDDLLKQIQPDELERKAMKRWEGYCFIGSNPEEKVMFRLGSGGNGKSLLTSLLSVALPPYCMGIQAKAFQMDCATSHKSMSHLITRPIRRVDVDESGGSKKAIDPNAVKLITNQTLSVDILYENAREGRNQSTANFNLNEEPKFDGWDGGLARRVFMQNYPSKFVDYEPTQENEFRKDPTLRDLSKLTDGRKCAIVKMIIDEAYAYYQEGLIVPDSWTSSIKESVEDNDPMLSFLLQNFEITKNKDDNVGKQEFIDEFKAVNRDIRWAQIKKVLELQGLNSKDYWNRNARINGSRGAYMGIKRVDTYRNQDFIDEM